MAKRRSEFSTKFSTRVYTASRKLFHIDLPIQYETNGRQTNKNRIPNFSILADTCNTWRRDFLMRTRWYFVFCFIESERRKDPREALACRGATSVFAVRTPWTWSKHVFAVHAGARARHGSHACTELHHAVRKGHQGQRCGGTACPVDLARQVARRDEVGRPRRVGHGGVGRVQD